eukprot:1189261-Prorocentrum_minimum.AAC.3
MVHSPPPEMDPTDPHAPLTPAKMVLVCPRQSRTCGHHRAKPGFIPGCVMNANTTSVCSASGSRLNNDSN